VDTLGGEAQQQRGTWVGIACRVNLREQLASCGDLLLLLGGVSLDEGHTGGDEGEN
jgi:hypothetical protein